MPDATYVGAGMPCGNCGNPLTPGQPHKCGRVENPYAPSSDWKPGQDTFTAQAAGIWNEGFAAGRAAFDAVVAERDEAIRQREQAATSRNMIAQQRDEALDRLTKLEREGGKHLARPAAEKLVSLTREGRDWATEQVLDDLGRVKAAEGRRLSHLEDALKHLREFVQDGEVRRIIDAALDGEDWDV